MNKATALSLLSNAVVVFNTVQFGQIIANLRETGAEVDETDLRRLSPIAQKHVIPNGTYDFGDPMEPPEALE